MKNLLLVNQALSIIYLSPTYPGTVNDKRIADASPYPLPANSILLQDLGFMGFSLNGVSHETPHKKPKGGELTLEQKQENYALAQRRVRIEHVNSSVKRCRTAKEVLRLLKKGLRDVVMEICCALHNFRIRLQPWKTMI